MAFTDYGLAKGLSVVAPWNEMTNQAYKRFGLEKDLLDDARQRTKEYAEETEPGQTFDEYNKNEYLKYVTELNKELTDFENQNRGYQINPELMRRRKAIINKYKNNDILRRSEELELSRKQLYQWVAEHPGQEHLVKDQLEELEKVRKNGNVINGVHKPFIFRAPDARNINDEISKIVTESTGSKIRHGNNLFWTETEMADKSLEQRVNQWISDPTNIALAKTRFAQLSPALQADYGGSPYNMIIKMARNSFIPKQSDPTRMYSSQPFGGLQKKTSKPTFSALSPFQIHVGSGTNLSNNDHLIAYTRSQILPKEKISISLSGMGSISKDQPRVVVLDNPVKGSQAINYINHGGSVSVLVPYGLKSDVVINEANNMFREELPESKIGYVGVRGNVSFDIDLSKYKAENAVDFKQEFLERHHAVKALGEPGKFEVIGFDPTTKTATVTMQSTIPVHGDEHKFNQYYEELFGKMTGDPAQAWSVQYDEATGQWIRVSPGSNPTMWQSGFDKSIHYIGPREGWTPSQDLPQNSTTGQIITPAPMTQQSRATVGNHTVGEISDGDIEINGVTISKGYTLEAYESEGETRYFWEKGNSRYNAETGEKI